MTESSSFPKLLAVAIVIHNQKGQILLNKRQKDPDKGKWQVVAGYVNPGERLNNTVNRLLKEKMGISSTHDVTFTGKFYDNPSRHPGVFCIPLLFTATVSNDVQITSDKEVKWFNKIEITDLEMALDNKQMLIDAKLI